jgi:hypothetical protein
MSNPPGRVTVIVAMAHRRSKGATMGTLLKPDPDPRDPAAKPAVPAKPEPEDPKPFEFIERPRIERDVYISRPELGRDRDPKR